MTYIKINKPYLDYHHFSDFHVFTMNNFVRNVMQKGKYKKAVKIVRLGLLLGMKIFYTRYESLRFGRSFRYMKRTEFHEETKLQLQTILNNKNQKFEFTEALKKVISPQYNPKDNINLLKNDERLGFYINLNSKISKNNIKNLSFFKIFNTKLPNKYKELKVDFDEGKYIYEQNGQHIITDEVPQEESDALNDKIKDQYAIFEELKFQKLYTKKPNIRFFNIRDLTVFDMVVQVYTMLTGAWYMRKSKVSGRTILIPSPLRPYRRITTVTKMLLKGIRKRRKDDRYKKNAMIDSISQEFYWLIFYNGIQYTPHAHMIDNSEVWRFKNDSHKELVANLKNIKHLKYF